MNEFFGLRKIAPLVRSYALPDASFDPRGEWHHRYTMFPIRYLTLASCGTFDIRRTNLEDTFKLKMVTDRDALSGFRHFTAAELICEKNNPLSTPLKWTSHVKTAKTKDSPAYQNTGMAKSAVYEGGRISFQTGRFSSSIPASGPFACKTALFDAAQRLSVDAKPLTFDYMDEYDQLGGARTLRYRGTYDVQMNTGKEPLSCFIETGAGSPPVSYWRDSPGRLLFWISGLMIYVLTEENGLKIQCELKTNTVRRAQKEAEASQ